MPKILILVELGNCHKFSFYGTEYRSLDQCSAGTSPCCYRVRGVDGSCAKQLTTEFFMVVMLPTIILKTYTY